MKIGIIGAGLTGLTAAFDLTKAGHDVTIFEATAQAGGLAAGFKPDEWAWSLEHYYHHWFTTDQDLLKLADEMGVRDKIIFPRPETVVYFEGKFYPLDSPFALLGFPGFNLLDKIRFGLTYIFLKLMKNGTSLEKHTAMDWMERAMGKRVSDVLWRPMLEGKFGKYARQVNMAWLWARITTRSPRLGTYQGGFQAFCDELANQVQKRGAVLHFNSSVSRVQPGGQGVDLQVGSQTHHFDRVLSTTSPRLMAEITPALSEAYRQKLTGLTNMGAVVLILALKHQLTQSYWFNLPKEAGYPFLALVEHTNFLPREHYGGDHLIYLGDYLETDHPHFEIDKDALVQKFLPSLKRFNPDFSADWVRESWIFRTKYAQPIPFLNHSQNIPALRTGIAGLWFASMSQVYPYDRGTNFAVELGRRVAREISQSK
ncbi:MAG TPA: NAD(P)/FAD-dependent oxidoreductase [Anaerolineales bacterium]|nr:NAD(P)/FAD-dependent oxidoreductase [Anaerolineales bacterium]